MIDRGGVQVPIGGPYALDMRYPCTRLGRISKLGLRASDTKITDLDRRIGARFLSASHFLVPSFASISISNFHRSAAAAAPVSRRKTTETSERKVCSPLCRRERDGGRDTQKFNIEETFIQFFLRKYQKYVQTPVNQ